MDSVWRKRILIFAPELGERTAVVEVLSEAGLENEPCMSLEHVCAELRKGAGAAIVAGEVLASGTRDELACALREQPDGCEATLLVITPETEPGNASQFGTAILVERPLRLAGLVSCVRAVVQARECRSQILNRLDEHSVAAEGLRDELAERNYKLYELNAALSRANSDVEQFAFSASHELREPLRNLAIYSEKLRRKAELELDEETRQCLTIVLKSAERMEALFRGLLAFMQVSGSTARPHGEVDSNAVLENVLAALQGAIRQSRATVHAEMLPPLSMTERHLSQLFENLIENALKYHLPGVQPEVHIFARQNAEETVLCVQDNGLGIAPQHQNKVFGLFKRLHTSEEYEGTGLGLAVCHKIAEQYGGRIWVESELGQGAVFCFRLPRLPESRSSLLTAKSAGN